MHFLSSNPLGVECLVLAIQSWMLLFARTCIGRKWIPVNESPLLNIIQHQFSLLGKIITENWIKLFNQNRGKEHSLTELALSWSQCPRRGMSSERALASDRPSDSSPVTLGQSTGKVLYGWAPKLLSAVCSSPLILLPPTLAFSLSCWFVLQAECLTRSFQASQSITSSLCKIFLNQQRFSISSTCLKRSLQASRSSSSKISVRGSRSFSRVWRGNSAYWQRCCWSI